MGKGKQIKQVQNATKPTEADPVTREQKYWEQMHRTALQDYDNVRNNRKVADKFVAHQNRMNQYGDVRYKGIFPMLFEILSVFTKLIYSLLYLVYVLLALVLSYPLEFLAKLFMCCQVIVYSFIEFWKPGSILKDEEKSEESKATSGPPAAKSGVEITEILDDVDEEKKDV